MPSYILLARLTDSLGFYLNDDNRQQQQLQSNDMLDVAAELKNKSDEIVVQQEMVCLVELEPLFLFLFFLKIFFNAVKN